MKVILRTDVRGLGNKGDVVDVKNGYGRNFLVPNGMAMRATPGGVDQAASMRRARDLADARDRDAAQTVADALSGRTLRIEVRAGAEGKLFGSVSGADIVEAIDAQVGATVDRKRVSLDEPIRHTGSFPIGIRLHPEVTAEVTVEVVATAG